MLSFDDIFGSYVSRNFYIVVVPLKRKSPTIKNLINPDEMDMEEVRSVKINMQDLHQTWIGICSYISPKACRRGH